MKKIKNSFVVGVATMLLAEVYGVQQMNKDWYVVNDGVMGGLSEGRAELLEDDVLMFSGVVSFENNGGFTSIRRASDFLSLNESTGIRLQLKGDGKRYQFRVRTSQRFDGVAYKHDFLSVKGEWHEVDLKWSDFKPTFRGREVPGAPELKASDIKQIGFLIADKQEGPFRLNIGAIYALF